MLQVMHIQRQKAANGKGPNGKSSVPRAAHPHAPRAARQAAGRALRERTPREAHATLDVRSNRDPLALIDATNAARLQELVPIRWGRMFESPFPFYRGAPAVMAFDLANTPVSGIRVQACGDAHILNFGGFATPERNLIVDLNDFDETHPAPWEWDVKRLAASIVVAARDVGGISDRDARDAVEATVRSYREHMRALGEMDPLSVYYEFVDATEAAQMLRRSRRQIRQRTAQVERQTHEAVPKLTELVGDTMRIVTRPPIIQPLPPEHAESARRVFAAYADSLRVDRRILFERFEVVDIALKVVGVGSVGTRCFIALLEADGHPFFLQVKEALPSVLEPYAGGPRIEHQGQRVVVGQQTMQAASDIFLGWASNGDRHFYVRQFRDMKISYDLKNLSPKELGYGGQLCGVILARAHARSGDAATIGGYLGKCDDFDKAIAKFAVAYADQNERDHALLQKAVHDGKIHAVV
ncbi:MAG: DUF2252 domain-containing protein [Polyangiaceae bacterium]